MFGIAWLTWPILLLIIQGVLGLAQVIVRLTPTKEDDVWFTKIEEVLGLFVPGLVKAVVPNLSKDSGGNTVVDTVAVTIPEAAPAPNQLKAIIAALSKVLSKK